MSGAGPSGTEGYEQEADALARQYESIPFAEAHRPILHLFPPAPARVLDIGAGTGRDAAGFAALGHRVLAIEPTAAMRAHAMKLHPEPGIEWLDDSLPRLEALYARPEFFDVVMLTAVWMHLDEAQRRLAMRRISPLVGTGGLLAMTLRHGPVPPGRRMFDVTAQETMALARGHGLACIWRTEHGDGRLGRPGVTWDRLVFRRDRDVTETIFSSQHEG